MFITLRSQHVCHEISEKGCKTERQGHPGVFLRWSGVERQTSGDWKSKYHILLFIIYFTLSLCFMHMASVGVGQNLHLCHMLSLPSQAFGLVWLISTGGAGSLWEQLFQSLLLYVLRIKEPEGIMTTTAASSPLIYSLFLSPPHWSSSLLQVRSLDNHLLFWCHTYRNIRITAI